MHHCTPAIQRAPLPFRVTLPLCPHCRLVLTCHFSQYIHQVTIIWHIQKPKTLQFEQSEKLFKKICKYWLKVVTVWRLIWGNDHLYCGFGARRSHLTLHWMSAQGSVGFRWGTITGPYHANFSQVETQKFDPHWFYCLQWGCNNLFCQECIYVYIYSHALKQLCTEWKECQMKLLTHGFCHCHEWCK